MQVLSRYAEFEPVHVVKVHDKRTGKIYENVLARTHASKAMTELHSIWYTPKKVVPMEYIDKHFSALSLAIWYLDDGTLTKAGTEKSKSYRIVLATNSFSFEEVTYLAKLLLERFGIIARVTPWQGNCFVLRMFQTESAKLLKIVNDVLPEGLQCMEYKLRFEEKEGVLS